MTPTRPLLSLVLLSLIVLFSNVPSRTVAQDEEAPAEDPEVLVPDALSLAEVAPRADEALAALNAMDIRLEEVRPLAEIEEQLRVGVAVYNTLSRSVSEAPFDTLTRRELQDQKAEWADIGNTLHELQSTLSTHSDELDNELTRFSELELLWATTAEAFQENETLPVLLERVESVSREVAVRKEAVLRELEPVSNCNVI